jgi:hypothetical protein
MALNGTVRADTNIHVIGEVRTLDLPMPVRDLNRVVYGFDRNINMHTNDCVLWDDTIAGSSEDSSV